MIVSDEKSILIADGDLSYCRSLQDFFNNKSYKKTDVLCDYSNFVEYIDFHRPAVVIMDMILPGNDGVYLLNQLRSKNISADEVKVIVVSAFYNEKYIKDAATLGVFSYLVKPVSPEILENKVAEALSCCVSQGVAAKFAEVLPQKGYAVMECASDVYEDEAVKKMRTTVKITKLLHDMGIPAHLCGHDYLRDAIIMVMNSHEVSGRMTKEIYPEIAAKYKKSPQSVERAIRTALDVAWTRGKTELINDIFRFTVNIQKGRPTNSEFVSLIADYLNYDYVGAV